MVGVTLPYNISFFFYNVWAKQDNQQKKEKKRKKGNAFFPNTSIHFEPAAEKEKKKGEKEKEGEEGGNGFFR